MQRSIIGCVGEIIRVRCSVSIVAAQVSQLNMQISEGGGGSRGASYRERHADCSFTNVVNIRQF